MYDKPDKTAFDMESRYIIIEALRSGIPSRVMGRCFSDARSKMLKELSGRIGDVCERRKSSGMSSAENTARGKPICSILFSIWQAKTIWLSPTYL